MPWRENGFKKDKRWREKKDRITKARLSGFKCNA